MTSKSVGVIGVGLMGHGIAKNIVSKGWPLGFLQHPGNQPTSDLEALGAIPHATRASVTEASDILLLCVTGSPEVEAVLTGAEGVLAFIRPGTIIIDCSTALPTSTEVLAAKAASAGARFLDAAMTRTPVEAEAGRLNLLIGGDDAVYAEVLPLLETFSENRFHAGPVGAGHKLKLLHNFVSLGLVTLVSEAAACAAAGGIEPELFVDVLKKGGGYGAALDRIAPFLLEGDVSRLRFSVGNAYKDLTYYAAMTESLGVTNKIASGVHATLSALMDAGHAADFMAKAPALLGALKPGRA